MLKKSLIVIIAPLFTTLLFTTAWMYGLDKTLGSPAPIKKTLADSGIYETVIPGLLDQAKQSTSSNGDIPLTNDIIKNAANKSFTPQVIRTDTENILDSTYKWLNGKTATPDFKIDFSSVKTSFAANVASSLQTQLAALPTCPANVKASSFDAFNATCLPKGLTVASAAAQVKTDLLSGKGFLDNPVITANDVKSGNSNTSVFSDQLQKVPKYFSWVKKAPFILGVLAILTGAAVVLLSNSREKGIRRISFTLIFVGVFMLVIAWVANYIVTQKALPKISVDNKVLQEKVQLLAKDLTQEVDKTYWIFGGAYTTLGVIGLASPMVRQKFGGRKVNKSNKQKLTTFGEQPVEHKPDAPAHTAAAPEKKKISIQ